MFTNDLACEQSRGVLIYVDKCLECNEINIGKKFKENIFIRLNSDLVIGNIYRSPNSNVENNNELCSLIQELSEKFSKFIVVGDFNFGDINWKSWCSTHNSGSSCEFINVLRDNLLLQHVDFPTRGRGLDSPHILDLVITNKDIVETVDHLAALGKSDHSVLLIGINVHSKLIDAIPKLNLNKSIYNKLSEYLHLNWDFELKQYTGDVEMTWSVIKHRLFEGVYKYIIHTNYTPFCILEKDKWKRPRTQKHD